MGDTPTDYDENFRAGIGELCNKLHAAQEENGFLRQVIDEKDAELTRLRNSGWQPCDTAPKDGTAFLAGWFRRSGEISVVSTRVIEWHEGYGCWRSDAPGPQLDWTHWMPIPELNATEEMG